MWKTYHSKGPGRSAAGSVTTHTVNGMLPEDIRAWICFLQAQEGPDRDAVEAARLELIASLPDILTALESILQNPDRATLQAANNTARRARRLMAKGDLNGTPATPVPPAPVEDDEPAAAMSSRDRREFKAYLRACTDAQVEGVYQKERDAGRQEYRRLAEDEADRRAIELHA